MVDGVSPDDLAIIKRFQPCCTEQWNGPVRDHPLWLLHTLWNQDKHRFLHSAIVIPNIAHAMGEAMFSGDPDRVRPVMAHWEAWPTRWRGNEDAGELHLAREFNNFEADGFPLAIFWMPDPPGPNPRVDVQDGYDWDFRIVFGKQPMVRFEALPQIRAWVGAIFDELYPQFAA